MSIWDDVYDGDRREDFTDDEPDDNYDDRYYEPEAAFLDLGRI